MPEDYGPLTVQMCITQIQTHSSTHIVLHSARGFLSAAKTESHRGNSVAACETTMFTRYTVTIIIKYFSQTPIDIAIFLSLQVG